MGFFSKLSGGSADTATKVVNDVKEEVSEKAREAVDAVVEKAEDAVEAAVEEKKDGCCGGNCGS